MFLCLVKKLDYHNKFESNNSCLTITLLPAHPNSFGSVPNWTHILDFSNDTSSRFRSLPNYFYQLQAQAQESRLKSPKQPDITSDLSSPYRIMHWIELASNFPGAIFFSHFHFSHESLLSYMFITGYQNPHLKFRNWLSQHTGKYSFLKHTL